VLLSSSLDIQKSLLSNLTAFQLLVAGALLLGVAAFLMALGRERRVSLKRSVVTDELAIHLGRIADSLDRIANQTRDRAHPTASRSPEIPATETSHDKAHHISYSMFGR